MKNIVFFLLCLSSFTFAQNKYILIEGQVTDSEKKSPIKGAIISVLSSSIGALSDSAGYYKIKVTPGKYKIRVSFVGFQSQVNEFVIKGNSKTIENNVSLKSKTFVTNEVTIVSSQQLNKPNMQVINDKDIVKMPNLFSDVMRGVKILPGVTSNNELTSAYYVRGGNYNENLIYLNGFTIYRPFLIQEGVEESQSILNQNMAKDLHFYNGAFPASLDDKISSALQVNYLDSFTEELRGEVSVDLFYTGAILKNRIGNLNWIGGFRYSYPSLFLSNLQTKGTYHPAFK
ncbi:MAG: TonB-dependent receptor, partial [Bacteroidota bacterium]|nr:TonB-dependent receptor [Bacteroidota bacterium]